MQKFHNMCAYLNVSLQKVVECVFAVDTRKHASSCLQRQGME